MSHAMSAEPVTTPRRRLLGASLVGCAVIALAFVALSGGFANMTDAEALSAIVADAGPWMVVLLLAAAVIVSPIPSGPIAMAAGALYGPLEGGALTALGALLGAMGAFGLSRWFGYQPLSASKTPLGEFVTRARSERRLALAVFVSRLIPFISFDAISYLAGLTSIRWRSFALATSFGVMPASFAFAALGAGAASWDSAALMVAACAITLVLPVGWFAIRWLRGRLA